MQYCMDIFALVLQHTSLKQHLFSLESLSVKF